MPGLGECRACNGVHEWQDAAGQTGCRAATKCGAGEYEVKAPTASSDRVCASHTECIEGLQWEERAATGRGQQSPGLHVARGGGGTGIY